MYTNIPTNQALQVIAEYLDKHKNEFSDIPITALLHALRIVMKNNIFTFGDTTWLQLSGTAMGTPPAPPYATLYYAIHEEIFLDTFSHRRPGLGPFKLTPNSSSLNFVFMIEFGYKTKFCSIVELTPNSSSLIFVRSWFVVNGVTYRRIRRFSENVIWVPKV